MTHPLESSANGWPTLQREIGSLEVGKVADFLGLTANPQDNITNTLALKYTVADGIVYDSETVRKNAPDSLAGSTSKAVCRIGCPRDTRALGLFLPSPSPSVDDHRDNEHRDTDATHGD